MIGARRSGRRRVAALLRPLARAARAWLSPRAMVLLYHRVSDDGPDPQRLAVRPEHFRQHLEVLGRHAHVLPLSELARRLPSNRWRPRTVAITFDDGYADNLHVAGPMLERAGLPATIFVAAGQVDAADEFWWDALERLFLGAGRLPERLSLDVDCVPRGWSGLAAPDGDADPAWCAFDPPSTARQRVYVELSAALKPLPAAARGGLLDRLFAWAGVDPAARPSRRALTSAELGSMAHGGVFEIGAHTVSHPVLAALPRAAQAEEIATARHMLEARAGVAVTGFAYPFGGVADYDREAVRIVREAGYAWACACHHATVTWRTDPFEIPRFLVADVDGAAFRRALERWFAR